MIIQVANDNYRLLYASLTQPQSSSDNGMGAAAAGRRVEHGA